VLKLTRSTAPILPDPPTVGKPLRPHAGWTPYLFLLPTVIVLGVFVIWAAVQVFLFSFARIEPFPQGGGLWSGVEWVGFENYRRVLGGGRFWWCLLNSFIYLLVTPALVAVSLLAALTVTSGLKGLGPWTRALLFLPVITPTIVAAVAWRVIFDEGNGLLNAGLVGLGLPAIGWLTEYPFVLITAMTVTMWKGFGYYMMIFAAALMGVPKELEEAATIDGAGRWGVFRHVTLPALRPVLVLVSLISSISALKVFDELYVTVRDAPATSQTAVPLVFETAFEDGSFGAACAVAVCLFLVILAFSTVQLRLAREDQS
jgi:putative chitobiose transport system permease protein